MLSLPWSNFSESHCSSTSKNVLHSSEPESPCCILIDIEIMALLLEVPWLIILMNTPRVSYKNVQLHYHCE